VSVRRSAELGRTTHDGGREPTDGRQHFSALTTVGKESVTCSSGTGMSNRQQLRQLDAELLEYRRSLFLRARPCGPRLRMVPSRTVDRARPPSWPQHGIRVTAIRYMAIGSSTGPSSHGYVPC